MTKGVRARPRRAVWYLSLFEAGPPWVAVHDPWVRGRGVLGRGPGGDVPDEEAVVARAGESRARDLHVEWLACDLRLQVACVTCACEWRVVSCVCAWLVATCACVIRGERVPAMQVHACKDPADDDSKAVVRARCVTCVAGVHALVCHAHASCT
jgi:hypothetical protein